MTRRTHLALLIGAVGIAQATPPEKERTSMFQEILEASQKDKKGVTLYVKGQPIVGLVVKISADSVEMKSREFSRIIVRMESIDGAAIG
jgi:hypothetical protein